MLFGKKERQAEGLIQRHIESVVTVVDELQRMVEAYCAECDEFKEEDFKVRELEHDADSARREAEMALYDGAFMPVERGDYVALLEHVDKVANQCEAVSDFLVLTRPEVAKEVQVQLVDIMNTTKACYSNIPKMFTQFENKEAVLDLARKVEEAESEVDLIYARLVRLVFKSENDLAHKLHIKMLLDRIAAISNRIEDASDRFCIIVAKRP